MQAYGIRPVHNIASRSILLCALLLLCCGTAAIAAAAPAAAGEVIYEGAFDPADLAWDAETNGKLFPVLAGGRHLEEPGLPKLPVRPMIFLIPMDRDVIGVTVEPLGVRTEDLPGTLAVSPAHLTDAGERIVATLLPNDGPAFPTTWGRFGGTHVWRGYRLLAVDVYPVREVNTDAGVRLEYLSDFAVRVQYGDEAPATDIAVRQRMVPGEAVENTATLQSLVANPEALTGYTRQNGQLIQDKSVGFQPTASPSLTGSAVEYLIITNAAMEAQFQVLADHKTAQGIPTVVTTREYIAANFRNGADIQETMRMFIAEAYQKWGISYVLLGGDSDILPPRYVKNSFYPTVGFTSIPSDLYFACLDGNWNANANSEFGEPAVTGDPGDDADFAEEVYVGRATVSTPAAATVFVNKVITYETTAAGAEWPNRTLFAAEVLFPDDWPVGNYIILDGAQYADQQVNEHIVPCTDMEYTRMFQTDSLFTWDAQLSREALIDTLNTGRYGIFNQIGHGYYFNMSVANANFVTTDADQLTNGDNLFMIYALNCASGAFDNSCLLERFLQNPNGGSICSVGSARAAFPNNSNNYQQVFFNNLYCSVERRVGRLVALSRYPFIGATNDNYVDRWTFENYTLLGDPTLAIWTASPRALSVVGPSSLDIGPQSVNFTITDSQGPAVSALVCLAMEGGDYVYGTTNILGEITLDFLAVGTGDAVLTITGRDQELTTITLPVTSGDSYLKIYSMAAADDGAGGSIGNGNGAVEAGETIALTAVLEETGGSGTPTRNGVLTTSTPGISIVSDTASFPGTSAGGFSTATGPFLVSIDPTVADGTPVVFQLDVADGPNNYLSEWTMTVNAPELEVVSLDWEDTTYGDGNGIVSNGERINVSFEVKNFGVGEANNLAGRLRTFNGNVVLYDSLTTLPDLAFLQTGSSTAVVSLSINDVTKHFSSYLNVVDDLGRETLHTFALTRPTAPLEIFTDTSLGADVIALSWEPPFGTNVFGYNVYRSDSEFGSYVRVNADVIAGTAYFRDEGLNQLTRYYYKVATVDTSRVSSPQSTVVEQATAPAEREGFPVPFQNETSGHLAVGDVDGDGDQEVVLASGQVYVWHHDGSELLDGDGDSQTLGNFTNFPDGYILQPAGITLANLDGIGGQEMIVSERAPGIKIHVFKKDGTEMAGWPRTVANKAGTDWNWASPAVGDVDGDGDMEIVVNGLNGWVHVWHHDGTELADGDATPSTIGPFYFRPGAEFEWSRSGPSLYDLDGDGAKDIIFGTRNDATGLKRLMAIRYDGTDVPGFPYSATGAIACDPAVADLDNNGIMEIVFYTSAKWLYAVQEDGSDYPGFPVYMNITTDLNWVGSPAVGNMDGDPFLEIIYAPSLSGLQSKIVVVDTDYGSGTAGQIQAGFPVTLPGSSEGSPVVGDINGDSVPDILHGIGGGDESSPYNLYAYEADGDPVDGFPITLTGPLMPSVVITDIDADSDVDIVYGGWDFLTHVWDMPFAYDRTNVPWPTFGGNNKRDGVYFSMDLVPVEDPRELPARDFLVQQPYPNPFNPSTAIRLNIPRDGDLGLAVFDLKGRKIRTLHTGRISSGWHTLVWDGRDDNGRGAASGVYFMQAVHSGEVLTRKMTLVK